MCLLILTCKESMMLTQNQRYVSRRLSPGDPQALDSCDQTSVVLYKGWCMLSDCDVHEAGPGLCAMADYKSMAHVITWKCAVYECSRVAAEINTNLAKSYRCKFEIGHYLLDILCLPAHPKHFTHHPVWLLCHQEIMPVARGIPHSEATTLIKVPVSNQVRMICVHSRFVKATCMMRRWSGWCGASCWQVSILFFCLSESVTNDFSARFVMSWVMRLVSPHWCELLLPYWLMNVAHPVNWRT